MDEHTQPEKQEETITFKLSHFYSVLVVLAFAVGVLVGYMAWGRNSGVAAPIVVQAPPVEQGPANNEQAQVPTAAPPQRQTIPTEGFPSLGPEDAPITIVEFSDYQCPFCRRFHEETYHSLLDAYPGKIRFVYRDFPLTSIHPEAFPAAVAAACAGEQDAYWPYHDKLFSSDQLGEAVYVQYATDLGLDAAAFQDCLKSGRYDEAINADADFATSIGVGATPTFYINGWELVGAQPLSEFAKLIDKELAGKNAQ